MGKDNKFSAFDYMQGGKIRKLGDQYGVDASEYNVLMGRPTGSGRDYKGDRDDYEKAVAAAAMNDYDTRRTMEAQALSGKKKARKYAEEGFQNITDVVKANNMRERWHKNAGNGGSFSSASDFAGQTMRAVDRERRTQTRAINSSVDEKVSALKNEFTERIKEQQEKAKAPVQTTPTSSRLADARKAVSDMDNGMFSGSPNQSGAPDSGEQELSLAQQMFSEKKKQVADSLRPKNPAGL